MTVFNCWVNARTPHILRLQYVTSSLQLPPMNTASHYLNLLVTYSSILVVLVLYTLFLQSQASIPMMRFPWWRTRVTPTLAKKASSVPSTTCVAMVTSHARTTYASLAVPWVMNHLLSTLKEVISEFLWRCFQAKMVCTQWNLSNLDPRRRE